MQYPLRTFPLLLVLLLAPPAPAQDKPAAPRGSLVEDRAASKLLAAGDARFDMDEFSKAVEIWQSVIERYPTSRVRFEAHLRLGNHLLERDRAYDRARLHFEAVKSEDNRDLDQRAEATLKHGVCFYHDRDYGKCFQIMREVIETFPVSPQVNEAYYYIGLGHFQLGHYSRAIRSLEKVGATLSSESGKLEKLEAGKRLFIRVEDADLAILDPEEAVEVQCESSGGDVETVSCYSVGRNVRLVLGSIPTRLGKPVSGNGSLEVKGGDVVKVHYIDRHTAEKELDRKLIREVEVVGAAHARITDGAYSESLRGVVLGKPANLQVSDADFDRTDEADELKAVVEIYRLKTDEELEGETVDAAAKGADAAPPADAEGEPQSDPYRLVDRVEITLVEAKLAPQESPLSEQEASLAEQADEKGKANAPAAAAAEPAADAAASQPEAAPAAAPPVDPTIHSGVFRGGVMLAKAETATEGDEVLQALPDDLLRVTFLDEKHRGEGVRVVTAEARCLEGNIGGVRVARAVISDQELRIQTKLKTADALTKIGNRYKEFGLKKNADAKYKQAVEVCEEIMEEAQSLGGRVLEQCYVQLWHVYYEMDQLNLAAAMCERLQREFPASGFIDDALLQLADVSRKQGEVQRAIGIYSRLAAMPTSQLRGDAQFGIAACYDEMGAKSEGPQARQYADRAFQEYKKVFDDYPDSGRVGEAVAKMANYYYQQKDYRRAIDTFESVLNDHPDAQYIDVILFNYGRCLYRMGQKAEARRRFDQVIGEFPESPLAGDAKKISEALAKAGF